MSNNADYAHGNITVWKLLWAIVKDTQWVTYIKLFLVKQDGCRAYITLYAALLGKQAINNHTSAAENALNKYANDRTTLPTCA